MSIGTKRKAALTKVWDRALMAEAGIKIPAHNKARAIRIRWELYESRKWARIESRKLYSVEDPSYDKSGYDHLVVRLKEFSGTWYVVIEPEAEASVEDLLEKIEELE